MVFEQAGIRLSPKKPRMKIRIIKHEVFPGCGSYEVKFPDGRPSKYFYFENLPGRRLRADRVERAVADRTPRGSPAKNRTSWIRNNGQQAGRGRAAGFQLGSAT